MITVEELELVVREQLTRNLPEGTTVTPEQMETLVLMALDAILDTSKPLPPVGSTVNVTVDECDPTLAHIEISNLPPWMLTFPC